MRFHPCTGRQSRIVLSPLPRLIIINRIHTSDSRGSASTRALSLPVLDTQMYMSAPEGRAYTHPHRRLLHKVHLPFRGPWPRGHRLALQNRAAARNVPLTFNFKSAGLKTADKTRENAIGRRYVTTPTYELIHKCAKHPHRSRDTFLVQDALGREPFAKTQETTEELLRVSYTCQAELRSTYNYHLVLPLSEAPIRPRSSARALSLYFPPATAEPIWQSGSQKGNVVETASAFTHTLSCFGCCGCREAQHHVA